jgi:hypothetical protein
MNILKFSRALQDPSEGVRMPAGILLAVPAVGYRAVHTYIMLQQGRLWTPLATCHKINLISRSSLGRNASVWSAAAVKKAGMQKRLFCSSFYPHFSFILLLTLLSLLFLLTLSSSSFPHVTSHLSSFPHLIPVRFLFFVAWFVSCLVLRSYLSLLRCSDPHTCVFRVSEGSIDCTSRVVSTDIQQSLRRCITKHLKASS